MYKRFFFYYVKTLLHVQKYRNNVQYKLGVKDFVFKYRFRRHFYISVHQTDHHVIYTYYAQVTLALTFFFFITDARHVTIRDGRLIKRDDNNITVIDLRVGDAMVLQCNASNTFGYVFADFYLNVLSKHII